MKNDFNLSECFDEFHRDLFRFLVKLTGDVHESEDILQDAYVRAYLKSALFNPDRGSLKNWVYKIAINIYYDRERFRA
ncbi:MAG TPA: RNA polymerase sigma factor, partial [Candidatus Wallbacteria bacterium]|nr:RNA polymerase sigma factor [Candidatus Wallbacteria bacterium]